MNDADHATTKLIGERGMVAKVKGTIISKSKQCVQGKVLLFMKNNIIALALLLFAGSAVASNSSPLYLYYSDSLVVKHERLTGQPSSHITYDGDISFSVYFYAGGFSKKDAVFANLMAKNNSQSKRMYVFNAVFFDKDNRLITSLNQTIELHPGRGDSQLGGMFSEVADGEWKRIRSYQFVAKELSPPGNERIACVIKKYDQLLMLQKIGYTRVLDKAMKDQETDIQMIRKIVNARLHRLEVQRYVSHEMSEKFTESLLLRDNISNILPINHHTYHQDGTKTRKLDDVFKGDSYYQSEGAVLFSSSRINVIGKQPAKKLSGRYRVALKWVDRLIQGEPEYKKVLELWHLKIHDAC